MSLLLLLFFSGAMSLFELERVSKDTEDILIASKENVDLAGDMLHTDLFRPPYARVTRKQLKVIAQRYHIVMWNVLSRDYNTALSPQLCTKRTLRGLRGGDIISLHDSAKSFKNTSVVLPALLERAKELGLKCKILEL